MILFLRSSPKPFQTRTGLRRSSNWSLQKLLNWLAEKLFDAQRPRANRRRKPLFQVSDRCLLHFRPASPGYVGAIQRDRKPCNIKGLVGGGGRTRTYEGLASGFTVRPLCRSGHSPASRTKCLADEAARACQGRFEAGLMLPRRTSCQLEMRRRSDGPIAPSRWQLTVVAAQYGVPSLCASPFPPVDRDYGEVVIGVATASPRRGRRFRGRRRPRRFRRRDGAHRRFPP